MSLFEPLSFCFDFKVVITNRRDALAKAILMHKGRGAQEGIFAELINENALAYVPTKTWLGNRTFMCAVLIAHNLTRELTMLSEKRRPAAFTRPNVHRSGRSLALTPSGENYCNGLGVLLRPQGKLTLSMSINEAVNSRVEAALHILEATT